MCWIMYASQNQSDYIKHHYTTISLTNRDGMGIAVYNQNLRLWEIHRTIVPTIGIARDWAKMAGNRQQIWHFRAATHGSIHVRNVQPLPIPPDSQPIWEEDGVYTITRAERVMAHNGMLATADIGTNNDDFTPSDSYDLAVLLAKLKPNEIRFLLKNMPGRYIVGNPDGSVFLVGLVRDENCYVNYCPNRRLPLLGGRYDNR